MGRKLLGVLLALAMLVGLMPGMSLTAYAAGGTDTLTREDTGRTNGSYGNWSGVTKTSGAVYAGNSAGSNDAIQLRSNNNNSGIVTTASGGKVTKVSVSWNENTQNSRMLNVYGKDSAYSAASELYGDDAGTLIGTIVCGSSTELTITDEYAYVGVRSYSGAMYLDSISFEWKDTSAPPTVPVTGVTLNPSTAQSINVGGSVAFTATVAPDGATDKTVKWSTTGGVTLYSDENCTAGNEIGADATSTLTVYAKGISAGSATITATSNADSEKKASCDVTVNTAEPESTYTLTIPSTLTVANSGWNATDGISATGSLATGKKLTVTATSANSWALKSGDNSVGYKLATASTDTEATTSWEFTELSSTATKKDMGIIVEDYSTKPAGTYQDTVTFTASVEDQAIAFTVKRVGGSNPNFADGNYTVAPGTTWQQFIDSGNAPACLSIGTWGTYRGKVCHNMDMNDGVLCCGGTIIANVSDKKRVKSGDAIIDGATYGCSDYLNYQDHD